MGCKGGRDGRRIGKKERKGKRKQRRGREIMGRKNSVRMVGEERDERKRENVCVNGYLKRRAYKREERKK